MVWGAEVWTGAAEVVIECLLLRVAAGDAEASSSPLLVPLLDVAVAVGRWRH
jgi:hypothetical protein